LISVDRVQHKKVALNLIFNALRTFLNPVRALNTSSGQRPGIAVRLRILTSAVPRSVGLKPNAELKKDAKAPSKKFKMP